MLEHVKDCGRKLTEANISELEKRLGVNLLSEYKSFLLKYNGGIPIPRAFPIEGLKNNPHGVVQEFLGIDCELESSNLDWNHEVMRGRLPSNLFAIACDDGGDLICISLYGNDAGSVVFWDRHQETNKPTYLNVYPIAKSFTEFIEGLQPLPDFTTS